jgi:6-pyruvoyltetrahydropterin/6-carboxytetrahydropterin synthase
MENIKYCQKIYADLPFGHRQHKHKGHCNLIHGHSWTFEFEFAARELDEAGFVVDFGGLKALKEFIDIQFDHTLVLNSDDPFKETLECMNVANITEVASCSSEGIADYIGKFVSFLIYNETGGRAWLHRVTVHEDSKNSATLYFEPYQEKQNEHGRIS